MSRGPTFGIAFDVLKKSERGFQPNPRFKFDSEGNVFGFANRDQYERWFSAKERAILREEGFKLTRYHVPKNLVKMDKAQGVAPSEWLTRAPVAKAARQSETIGRPGKPQDGPGRWVTMRGTHVFITE